MIYIKSENNLKAVRSKIKVYGFCSILNPYNPIILNYTLTTFPFQGPTIVWAGSALVMPVLEIQTPMICG